MILFLSDLVYLTSHFYFARGKIMNMEYLLIGIALGRTSAEANNITLTDEDKEAIEWHKKESEKAKKEERRIVFFAPDMD